MLALSAFCSPYVRKGDLGRMGVPVMYQGGTLDLGVTPTIRRLQGAYDLSPPPKYYVEIAGAGHFAWTNLNPKYHELIGRYSVAFFDRYLKAPVSREDPTAGLKEKTSPDALGALMGNPPPKGVSYLRADAGVDASAARPAR